jgi:hypothetical protein
MKTPGSNPFLLIHRKRALEALSSIDLLMRFFKASGYGIAHCYITTKSSKKEGKKHFTTLIGTHHAFYK